MNRKFIQLVIFGVFFFFLAPTFAQNESIVESFNRLGADSEDPNGNSVSKNCGGDYLSASANLEIVQGGGKSAARIEIQAARPNTLFTLWLRLKGEDSSGNAFGGSPLTDGGSTPLAPSSHLDELLAATGAGNGSETVANGFFTNQEGNGQFDAILDFPIMGGAYPFQTFEDFDPLDARFPISNPKIFPVSIVIPDATITAPFGIRLASHCTDSLGHGLTPGNREPWFDWPE